MVRTRKGDKTPLAKAAKNALELFGRKDIQFLRREPELDNDDRVIGHNETKKIISGDLQYVSFRDRQILQSGIASIGNGMFYALASLDLREGDVITVKGSSWELTEQVEAEDVGAEESYQAWVCVRQPSKS